MNVLGQFLDARDDKASRAAEADKRWMREHAGLDADERLQKWDTWLRKTLAETLQWPADKAAAARLQCQCAHEMTTMVRQLRGRGWLLDGEALAQHVRECLQPIATYQKAGKVGDFWPYFRAAVRRYVGGHAEDIQQQARRTGADEGAQSFNAILGALGVVGAAKLKNESLTELITSRAAKTAPKPLKRPAVKPACKTDALELPGL